MLVKLNAGPSTRAEVIVMQHFLILKIRLLFNPYTKPDRVIDSACTYEESG